MKVMRLQIKGAPDCHSPWPDDYPEHCLAATIPRSIRGYGLAKNGQRELIFDAPGEYVIAEFRLGAELLLDVRHDQQPHLSDFKSRVALHLDRERIIKFWEPIPEDEPGERPWWKTENAAFGS